jgi:hypothetical protein
MSLHELSSSFIRRARSASYWELQLMKRAHINLGCEPVFGMFRCWKCEVIRRAER